MTTLKTENDDNTDELSLDDKKSIEYVSILSQLELTALLHKKHGLSKAVIYSATKILERIDEPVLCKILLNIINHPNPPLHLKVMRKRLEEAAGGRVHW